MNIHKKHWTMSDCSKPDLENGGRYGVIQVREEGRVVAQIPPYEDENTFTHEEALLHSRMINAAPDMYRVMERLTASDLSFAEVEHLRQLAGHIMAEINEEQIVEK